jgi:hypothetical protein
MMVGLIIAGPWLTMVGARLVAGRSRRPAALIAARRLADDPKAAFRAVSGMVLALFVTSVAVGVITTIVANRGVVGTGTSSTTLTQMFYPEQRVAVPAALGSTSGVRGALVVHPNPAWHPFVQTQPVGQAAPSPQTESLPGVVSCADLDRIGTLGHCPAGATAAEVWDNVIGPEQRYSGTWRGPATVWPAAPLSAADLQRLPVRSIAVDTDGTAAAIERARTILEVTFPDFRNAPSTEDDGSAANTATLAGWQRLAAVVILASLPIAGCSLAVSVVSGLSERKRPFSLLRLTGVPLRALRRIVTLESGVPLVLAALVAVGAGLLAADLFLRAQMQYTLRPPGLSYYIIVLVGVAASLGIVAGTLPVLGRITGPETARNE